MHSSQQTCAAGKIISVLYADFAFKVKLKVTIMKIPAITRPLFLLCFFLNTSFVLRANVSLPTVLSNHMVLQRGQPIHIWGSADPGETVSVELNNARQNAVADRIGRWDISLPPQSAGGPYKLVVKGANVLELEDVMVRRRLVRLRPIQHGNAIRRLSRFGRCRQRRRGNSQCQPTQFAPVSSSITKLPIFPNATSNPPLGQPVHPKLLRKFSAVAYFFGKQLAEREHVTIGLIDSTWGGTPAEAWVSMHSLASDASLMPVFAQWANFADQRTDIQATLTAENREDEAARKANKPLPNHPWHP